MSTSLSIKDKILYDIDLSNSSGLEIGPLMNPLVKKTDGNIKYVDRASTEEIKEWYKKNKTVDQDKIVDVDYVWGEKTLFEASGGQKFDYCVAAHVIEHVPDLIGWLQEIEAILKDNGIAAFSVPDRRYTFDYLRPETITADLLEAYYNKLKKPSIRHIYDHFSAFTEIDIVEAWSDNFDGSTLKPIKDPQKVRAVCEDAAKTGKYIDSHCWVFTAISFFELLDELNQIGLFDFKIRQFFDVEYHNFEFVVQLEKIPAHLSQKEKRQLFLTSLEKLKNHIVKVNFISYPAGEAQVYYDAGNGFTEFDSVTMDYSLKWHPTTLQFELPPVPLTKLRFDPVKKPAMFKIFSIEVLLHGQIPIKVPLESLTPSDHLKIAKLMKNGYWGTTYRKADDPFVLFDLPEIIKTTDS